MKRSKQAEQSNTRQSWNLVQVLFDYIYQMMYVNRRALWYRSWIFVLIIILTIFCFLRPSLLDRNSARVVNGSAYALLGEVSIPLAPTYSCPYFKLMPENKLALSRKCSTCAVVSNSGRLLNSNLGDAIDSTDCVFRMNNGSTEDIYKKDVGQKLTFRVLSNRGMSEYDDVLSNQKLVLPESFLVWDSMIRYPRLDRVSEKALKISEKYRNVSVYILNNHPPGLRSLDTFMDAEVGGSHSLTPNALSGGFYTLVVAAYLCDEIVVYGLSPPNFCQTASKEEIAKVRYHYQPPWDKVDECAFFDSRWNKTFFGHKFVTEHMIFERWSKHRRISFKPSWL